MQVLGERPQLSGLLKHFAAVTDICAEWRVVHPLPEVLLVTVSGAIASCDDCENIVERGGAPLDFVRRLLPYHHGLPCADSIRVLMNRIEQGLLSAC